MDAQLSLSFFIVSLCNIATLLSGCCYIDSSVCIPNLCSWSEMDVQTNLSFLFLSQLVTLCNIVTHCVDVTKSRQSTALNLYRRNISIIKVWIETDTKVWDSSVEFLWEAYLFLCIFYQLPWLWSSFELCIPTCFFWSAYSWLNKKRALPASLQSDLHVDIAYTCNSSLVFYFARTAWRECIKISSVSAALGMNISSNFHVSCGLQCIIVIELIK